MAPTAGLVHSPHTLHNYTPPSWMDMGKLSEIAPKHRLQVRLLMLTMLGCTLDH